MHLLEMGIDLAYFVEHGGIVGKNHLLRQISHRNTRRDNDIARCRFLQTGYDLEHGALTRTVLTDESYLVLGIDYIVYIIEEHLSAEFDRKVIDRYHLLSVSICKDSKFRRMSASQP